jgi:hypothetical protein
VQHRSQDLNWTSKSPRVREEDNRLIASSVMRCAFQGQGQTCKQGRVLFTPLYCHVSYATNTYSTHACANIIFRRGKDKSSMPGYTLSMPLQRERERVHLCGLCVCQRQVIRTSFVADLPCSISQGQRQVKVRLLAAPSR